MRLPAEKVKRNVVGIIGLVENMLDGNAQSICEMCSHVNYQTVGVINTDAEGRLVLADVLTYVQDTYKPQAIVDRAFALTGVIIVSLGKEYAGLFSNNAPLAQAVSDAGGKVDENAGVCQWAKPMTTC